MAPFTCDSVTTLCLKNATPQTGNPVQQVTQYKLLGVTINAALNWNDHVNAITSKAAKQPCFFKLKLAAVVKEDLAYFFQTVVRPILEYACP